ncbi:MAG: ABC transporter ATP-binding protein, partial [Clostridiales bacterium]|nr:ABC transporter ATP-binding protein [Clostridiales bacterium]
MAILEVKDINVSYGSLQVLWDVSLEIEEGKIVALLGANGAGKTTLLNAMTGMIEPTSGEVIFKGEVIIKGEWEDDAEDGEGPEEAVEAEEARKIKSLPADRIIEKGIAYLPEGGRLFPEMTIKENLEMGAYPRSLWRNRKPDLERMYKLFPILEERKNQLARTMSGGERQMLAMGRALMSNPTLCFFDELSYGLSPVMAQAVFKIVKQLHEEG